MIKIIRTIRFLDSAVFLAPAIIGIVLSFKHISLNCINLFSLSLYLLAIYLLAIHVFLFNDWSDFERDLKDQNKISKHLHFKSLKYLGFASVFSGIFPLCIFLFFSYKSFVIAGVLLILSILYSSNWLFKHGKNTPGYSSLLHITGGTLSFVLGYIYNGGFEKFILITGLTFGFFLTGGHLFQEIQDIEGDKINNLLTTAIVLGKKKSFFLGLSSLGIGHLLLYFLMIQNYLPNLIIMNLTIEEKNKLETFVSIFQLLKCWSSAVSIHFLQDKMTIQIMDKSQICFTFIQFDKSWFSTYIQNGVGTLTKATVQSSQLTVLMNHSLKHDILEIILNEETDKIQFKGNS